MAQLPESLTLRQPCQVLAVPARACPDIQHPHTNRKQTPDSHARRQPTAHDMNTIPGSPGATLKAPTLKLTLHLAALPNKRESVRETEGEIEGGERERS